MNIAVAQSGGPTCAINASLVGVFSEALKEPSIDAIFGSINGIEGMIDDHLIDLKTMIRTNEDMEMLLQTPSTVLHHGWLALVYVFTMSPLKMLAGRHACIFARHM